jgi:capsule polysaccharide export protein KpsE/RkpR
MRYASSKLLSSYLEQISKVEKRRRRIALRRIYATQEFSFTYTVYAISALKQFFFFFFLLYLFVLGSYLVAY